MNELMEFVSQFNNAFEVALYFLGATIAGMILSFVGLKLLKATLYKATPYLYNVLNNNIKASVYFLFPVFLLYITCHLQVLDNHIYKWINQTLYILFVFSLSWIMIRLAYVMEDLVFLKFNISKSDNRRERKIITQVQFIKRLLIVVIWIIAISFILMSFEGVQKIGQGILTSAGVIGILIGVAAQKSIANLLAGFQIAFTQPIKMDDVVIIENEWGNIEEINLTYVVVKLWDLRRLVVPLSYFLEKPFQNWTRETSDMIGTAFLYVDYSVRIDVLRDKLKDIVTNTPLWDGKTAIIQVTNVLQNCIELRVLVTARNAPEAFDLRCEVREKLIGFLQEKHPGSLPKYRTDMAVNQPLIPPQNL